MSHLILVRHSNPDILTDRPAKYWHRSALGEERARAISTTLDHYNPSVLFSSSEPKAIETASILASSLEVPQELADGLQEHERSNVSWTSAERFRSQLAEFFARPNERVFGDETASQARDRFSSSVRTILEDQADGSVAIISHGTVITLFVCAWNDLDPYQFWLELEMPSLVILTLPTFEIEAVLSVDSDHIDLSKDNLSRPLNQV